MIDIEKERELVRSGYVKNALDYLDELEATRNALEWEKQLATAAFSEVEELRSQLTDQRARDIRMMVVEVYGTGCNERDVANIAAEYDRLAAIPVPPAKEADRD
jgi:hypothetical protein